MKRTIIAGIIAALGILSQSAFAVFSIDDLKDASAKAIEDFKTVNPDHVQHFTGYKVWISGEDSKVKVYVTHDGMNMTFDYNCHKHDNAIECHSH